MVPDPPVTVAVRTSVSSVEQASSPAIDTDGLASTVSVTAALLKHDVVLLDTLAYTVVEPLTKAAGVAIAVVSPALLNQVTVTPAAPPVTVLLTLVKLNEAVPPPVVVSHKVMLAVLAAGLELT